MSTYQMPNCSGNLSQTKTPPAQYELRESHDAYCGFVAGDQKYRIILCRDQLQWIIQRAVGRGTSITRREWRGFSYHREQASLIRRVEEICGGPVGELFGGAGCELAALPKIYRDQKRAIGGGPA